MRCWPITLLLLQLPRLSREVPVLDLEAWVDTAEDAFSGSKLAITQQMLQDLLFDSLEDYRRFVSFSKGNGTWAKLLPGYSTQMLEDMLLAWPTPAEAWRTAFPDSMQQELLRAVDSACAIFCGSRVVGDCCLPEHRCQRVHEYLRQVTHSAQSQFSERWSRFHSLSQRMVKAAWPLALPALMPAFLGVARIIDDFVRFWMFLWSRMGSNPTLQPCLSGQWGKTLKDVHLTAIRLWRDLRRSQEDLAWEVIATGRFQNSRWSQMGLQIGTLYEKWQQMSNILIMSQRVLKKLEEQVAQAGWASLAAPASESQNLDPAADGEFPSLMLSRCQFTGSGCVLDKAVLRFLLRHVLTAGQTLGEFGAFNGEYSAWLNETGLVEAFAYDGIPAAAYLSDGRVQELQLAQRFDLGRRFDWILCLEVGEHLPVGSEDILLDNIDRHAAIGAIISWATPEYADARYHPNTMTAEMSAQLIERHGFLQDRLLTQGLRQVAETQWLKDTIAVYHKPLAPDLRGGGGLR